MVGKRKQENWKTVCVSESIYEEMAKFRFVTGTPISHSVTVCMKLQLGIPITSYREQAISLELQQWRGEG